jgi:hypothetical protein
MYHEMLKPSQRTSVVEGKAMWTTSEDQLATTERIDRVRSRKHFKLGLARISSVGPGNVQREGMDIFEEGKSRGNFKFLTYRQSIDHRSLSADAPKK